MSLQILAGLIPTLLKSNFAMQCSRIFIQRSLQYQSKNSFLNLLVLFSYYLTDGVKFGGDWLAYPGDPLLFHAQFVVRVVSLQETMNPLLFVASTREAHAARKHLLLAFTTQVISRFLLLLNQCFNRTQRISIFQIWS